MQITANLSALRKQKTATQQEVADYLNLTRSAYTNIESARRGADYETVQKLAEYFNVSVDYLIGATTKPTGFSQTGIKIPVFGTVPAGIAMEAIEDIEDYEEIPESWLRGEREYFALRIKGDSMYPDYLNGDTVIFQKSQTCTSGDECVVMVNGTDATFKKIIRRRTGIMLQPLNTSKYEPEFYTNEEIENLPVTILGIAKELRRRKKL